MFDYIEGLQGVAFGTVDGMITILGVVIGIATATQNSGAVIVAGLVAGLANAFGNTFGFYASELAERAEHIQENEHLNSINETNRSTLLAFLHSVASTIVIVAPFIIFGLRDAMVSSLIIGLVLLFALGIAVGKFSHASPWRFGIRYVLLGLIGTALSFIVGVVVGQFLTLTHLIL
ncbi:MAG TPA: VIT1/CCC1 transporter family protein [Candidatus Acidoferrales bacterium]|nr:VIT1/CCC1 transporter family protein [Candidatus Acidoferrales bacterium]